jgi:hypothetical protein
MEVPSQFCSCDSECPCWEGCCKENYPILKDMSRNLEFTNCPRCGAPVGSMQVHDRNSCLRNIERAHKVQEASKIVHEKFAGAFKQLAENDKMTNDEELARTFYNVAKRISVPQVRQDDRGDYAAFEDLSLRDVKLMAQFVRELRK